MRKITSDTKFKLRQLLLKNYVAELMLLRVAENIPTSIVRDYFVSKAIERLNFRSKLEHVFRTEELGITITDHNEKELKEDNWLNFPNVYFVKDAKSLLSEVKNGDRATIRDYQDVIDALDLYPEIKSILISQINHIQLSYNSYHGTKNMDRIRQVSA